MACGPTGPAACSGVAPGLARPETTDASHLLRRPARTGARGRRGWPGQDRGALPRRRGDALGRAEGGARRAAAPRGAPRLPRPAGRWKGTPAALVSGRNDATLAGQADLLAERAGLYRPRPVGHRFGAYAARATAESCSSRIAAGGRKPCRSVSQVAL